MKYTTTHIIYFSPTHTSQKIARAIGEGIGMGRRLEIDLTLDSSDIPIEVKDSLTVIVVPVYAGRVAPVALQRLKRLHGSNSVVVLAAVYGNRDYEDTLVELRDLALEKGFVPLTAGAFVGEHSYSRKGMPIAENRPDKQDLELAKNFGKESLAKLEAVDNLESIDSFMIKGNVPYREVAPSTPVAPITLEGLCCVCEECIKVCPTDAIFINQEGFIDTDKSRCIKCCACVKECPSDARLFDTPYTAMLHKNFSVRREPEVFY